MKIVVPDASVLLKWVLPGPPEVDTAHAIRLRDAAVDGNIILRVPSLWIYAVRNNLARQFPDQTPELLGTFQAFGLEEEAPEAGWLEEMLRLARSYRVTVYGAAYHALAKVRNGTFVTADTRYIRRARAEGHVEELRRWNLESP